MCAAVSWRGPDRLGIFRGLPGPDQTGDASDRFQAADDLPVVASRRAGKGFELQDFARRYERPH